MNYQDNRLLNNYNRFIQNNVPFQNNNLLYNNPMFQNNMNNNNSQQMQMMQMAHMQKMKELQELKKIEKLNELEKKYDKNSENMKKNIKDILINYDKDKIDKEKQENKLVAEQFKNYKQVENQYKTTREKYIQERTNQPYKNIIKDEKYINKFIEKPKEKIDQKELIVHRVTNADKEGVEEECVTMDKEREKHDGELKVIYSSSKENEHKKKFEYNHKYKYRIKYDPSDHKKLKDDKISYFKKEQKKIEDNKEKIQNIYESLKISGIFSEEELNDIGMTNESLNKLAETQSKQFDNNNQNKTRIVIPTLSKKLDESKKERYRNRQKK